MTHRTQGHKAVPRRTAAARILRCVFVLPGAIGCAAAQPPVTPPPAEPAVVAMVAPPPPAPALSSVDAPNGACPEFSRIDSIPSSDLSGYGVAALDQPSMRATLGAASELQQLAAAIDADMHGACSRMLKDFGVAMPEEEGSESLCKAAAKAIGDLKAKAGGTFSLSIKPPSCTGSMDEMADCAGRCDAALQGPVSVKCSGGELSGECAGKCAGKCSNDAGAVCGGTCEGTCDATVSGTCLGPCQGKCDGKTSSGECSGMCEGKCNGTVRGVCQGTCRGACTLNSPAECRGRCQGMCNVAIRAPRCSGVIEPPSTSGECRAWCETRSARRLDCSLAQLQVKAAGVADARAAQRLIVVLSAQLPMVLKLSIGMNDRVMRAVVDVTAVVAHAHSGRTDGTSVSSCVVDGLQKGAQSADAIRGDLNMAVNLMATVSASPGRP